MAQARILPHREADPESVEWGSWWVHINGDRQVAGPIIDGWDYSTPASFELQPSVVEDLFLTSTGQPSLWNCDVVALVECPSTGYRFSGRRSLAELATGSEKLVVVEPPLGSIAEKVILSAQIVVARDSTPPADDVAHRRGAKLLGSARHALQLEGSGARFPTDAVPFSQMRYPAALWTVHADFADPEEPFNAAVRLFINTEHPRAQALVDTTHPEHELLSSALETDLVRQLLRAAAEQQERFERPQSWPEGSVGAALESMSGLFFGDSLSKLIAMQRMDPPAFDRLLHSRMNLFGGRK